MICASGCLVRRQGEDQLDDSRLASLERHAVVQDPLRAEEILEIADHSAFRLSGRVEQDELARLAFGCIVGVWRRVEVKWKGVFDIRGQEARRLEDTTLVMSRKVADSPLRLLANGVLSKFPHSLSTIDFQEVSHGRSHSSPLATFELSLSRGARCLLCGFRVV